MTIVRQKTMTGKILDNVFFAEVFGERDEQDIPKILVLGMAKCFDLTPPPAPRYFFRAQRKTDSMLFL